MPHEPTTRSSVVFFAPEQLKPEVRAALEEALTTQLSLLHATVYYAGPATRQGDPIERVRSARRAVARYGAIATFWLDAPETRPWELYAADAGITRVVVRRLASGHPNVEANIESVALIVRATTDALLHGEPMPAEDVSDESKAFAPWPVERLDQGSSAVRLSGAYTINTFAPRQPWQQGVSLRAAFIWPSGPYLGVGFTILQRLHYEIETARFDVDRYPISLHAGLRFQVSRLTFIGELGVELEIRNRRTLPAADKMGVDVQSPAQTTVFNICPKLEAELTVLPWLVIFGGAGLDFVVGNFPYRMRNEPTDNPETWTTKTILEPYFIRLGLHAGIAFMH